MAAAEANTRAQHVAGKSGVAEANTRAQHVAGKSGVAEANTRAQHVAGKSGRSWSEYQGSTWPELKQSNIKLCDYKNLKRYK